MGALGTVKRGLIELDGDIALIVNKGEASSKPLLSAIHALNLCEDFDAFKVVVRMLLENLARVLYINAKRGSSYAKSVIEDLRSVISTNSLEVIKRVYGGVLDRTDIHSLLERSCLKRIIEVLGSEKLVVESEVSIPLIEDLGRLFEGFSNPLKELKASYKVLLNRGRLEVGVDSDEPLNRIEFARVLTSVLERVEDVLAGLVMRFAPDPLFQGLIYVTWNSEESALSWLSGNRSSCSSFRHEGIDVNKYEYNATFVDVLYYSFWEKVTRSFCHYKHGERSEAVEDKLCLMLNSLKYLIRGRYVLESEEFLYALKTERLPLKFFSPYVRRLLFVGLALSNAKEGALVIIEDADCCVPPRYHPLLGLAAMTLSETLKVRIVMSTSSSLVALPFILQRENDFGVMKKISFEIYELNDEEVKKVSGDHLKALYNDFDPTELENYVKILIGSY